MALEVILVLICPQSLGIGIFICPEIIFRMPIQSARIRRIIHDLVLTSGLLSHKSAAFQISVLFWRHLIRNNLCFHSFHCLLHGRFDRTVEPSDLTTLCAYLWTAPEERTIIQSTLERMCNDPLKDRLDTILAEAVEGYQEFTDTADAPAARRIGKLRDEFMSLYITLSQMLSNAQSDAEREKINACLEELERYSKEAHASVQYSYVPLRELYDLKAS